MHLSPRTLTYALLAVSLALASVHVAAADDPLPSWTDGAARRAILDFVQRVTAPGGKDFVPESERIATFDNDGTLWAEQPIVASRRCLGSSAARRIARPSCV